MRAVSQHTFGQTTRRNLECVGVEVEVAVLRVAVQVAVAVSQSVHEKF